MTSDFEPITLENLNIVKGYIKGVKFCDFTPFVLASWQKMFDTAFAVIENHICFRMTINGDVSYAFPNDNITESLDGLKSIIGDTPTLTLVSKNGTEILKNSGINCDIRPIDGWGDYIYNHENLAKLTGKRYAGQRNHINKFTEAYPDFTYEEITKDNIGDVRDFFNSLPLPDNMGEYGEYEHETVKFAFEHFCELHQSGGFIASKGEIFSFAMGEVTDDTLFVHIEKARRDVNGAYPVIVREFARHNPTKLINREEDMGVEGLRTSKLSYHPVDIIEKFQVKIK